MFSLTEYEEMDREMKEDLAEQGLDTRALDRVIENLMKIGEQRVTV